MLHQLLAFLPSPSFTHSTHYKEGCKNIQGIHKEPNGQTNKSSPLSLPKFTRQERQREPSSLFVHCSLPLALTLQVPALLPSSQCHKREWANCFFRFPRCPTMVATTKFKFAYRFENTSKHQKTFEIEVSEGNCRVVVKNFATLKAFRQKSC